MSDHKVPAELIRSNIGKLVVVDIWKEYHTGTIEKDSEVTYVGTLNSYALHTNFLILNIGEFHGITVRHDHGDKINILV